MVEGLLGEGTDEAPPLPDCVAVASVLVPLLGAVLRALLGAPLDRLLGPLLGPLLEALLGLLLPDPVGVVFEAPEPVLGEPFDDGLVCGQATEVVITPVDPAFTVVITVVTAHTDEPLTLEGAG